MISGNHTTPIKLYIPSMDCSNEANEIRESLSSLKGIKNLSIDLKNRIISMEAATETIGQTKNILVKLGFEFKEVNPERPEEIIQHKRPWIRLIGALITALVAELIHQILPDSLSLKLMTMLLSLMAISLSGLPVYIKGLSALKSLRLNINALISVAVTGAFLIGHWPEAGTVMALYSLAELLEGRAAERARNTIRQLFRLVPDTCEVQQANDEWQNVPVDQINKGQHFRVSPGARIALDGDIVNGDSAVNQSAVTGESLPVEKKCGDKVYAGTLNTYGTLIVKASSRASESTLSRIIYAVEEAQESRAPTQRFIDRFAAKYSPAVFVLALLIVFLSPVVLGLTIQQSIYNGLVLLVVACPCALVIATPVTMVSGLTAAARQGIVIKGGIHLEQVNNLQIMAFDKTGTLTTGTPKLKDFEPQTDRFSRNEILTLASNLASRSKHPISHSIATALKATNKFHVEHFNEFAGKGITGTINHQEYWLGKPEWYRETSTIDQPLEHFINETQKRGHNVTLLWDQYEILAYITISDQIRKSALETVRRLHRYGISVSILSGDNRGAVQVIADQLGTDQLRANLLPEQKLEAIKEFQKLAPTGMAGDGINDAPALAAAHTGFAMGAVGSETAMDAADVVIMDDNPLKIADTIEMSKKTMKILWQNIYIAIFIKGTFLILTALDQTTMWMAVFSDMGTSLLVIWNSLRLSRHKSVETIPLA